MSTWLTEFERTMQREYAGTAYAAQVPGLVAFEAAGIEASEFVGDDWCHCEGVTPGAETYFRKPGKGTHGWFHDPRKDGCGGITQTG